VSVAHFAGRVLECCTRFAVKKATTAYLTHFDANWILTLEVEAAGEGLPFTAGAEQAFAIHSPVQLLFDSAEQCVGKRYELAVELDEATGKPKWQTLRRR
jgi:hypothetical protein